MRINKNTILYGAFILSLSGSILQILLFIYRIILSRLLGAEAMGVYQLIFSPMSVMTSLALSGLTIAAQRLSANYMALGDMLGVRRLLRITQIIFTIILSPLALIMYFGARFIAEQMLGDLRVWTALLIMPVYILLVGIENIHKACLQGVHDVKPVAFSEVTELIIRMISVTGLLIILTPNEPGIAALLILSGMICGEIFSTIFLFVLFRRRYKLPRKYNYSKDKKLYKNITGIAVPIALAGTLNNFLNSANSVILPRALVSAGMSHGDAMKEFGILSGMVTPLFMLPFSFIGSLSAVIVPRLSKNNLLGDKSDIRRKAGKSIHATSLFALPVITVLIPLANPLCELIYGQSIRNEYILPLALGTIFTYYSGICCSILYGIGSQKAVSVILVSSEVVQLAFTAAVASNPKYGIYGFLAGHLVSSAFEGLLSMIIVARRSAVKIQVFNWFIIPFVSAALCGYTAKFAYEILRERFGGNIAVIPAILMACGFYYLFLRIQGMRPGEYLKAISTEVL